MNNSKRMLFAVAILFQLLQAFDADAAPPNGKQAGLTAAQGALSLQAKTPVVFVHDAAIDEYMATVLLATMPEVDLRAIVIVNADCIAGPAMNAAWKIQSFLKRPKMPLGLSDARGWNQFPWPYRSDCIKLGNIAQLKNVSVPPNLPYYPPTPEDAPTGPPTASSSTSPGYPSGDALLRDKLAEAADTKTPVTLLMTCPLTPLSNLLRTKPSLAFGIREVIWMGGAVNGSNGNIDPSTIPAEVANGYAEWNAFWDPWAVDWILKNTQFPLTVFPLNVTDQAAITHAFLDQLKIQSARFQYSKLAYDSYSLVKNVPTYEMWDVVTTCYLARPAFFDKPQSMRLKIITEGYFQGSLVPDPGAPRNVQVVLSLADPAGFYKYVLHQLQK